MKFFTESIEDFADRVSASVANTMRPSQYEQWLSGMIRNSYQNIDQSQISELANRLGRKHGIYNGLKPFDE